MEIINIIHFFVLANNNDVSLINDGKVLTVPNELADIGVEVFNGQTVFINLRTANLKIIWKSNVIFAITMHFKNNL